MDVLKDFDEYKCTCPDNEKYIMWHDGNVCRVRLNGVETTNGIKKEMMEKDKIYHFCNCCKKLINRQHLPLFTDMRVGDRILITHLDDEDDEQEDQDEMIIIGFRYPIPIFYMKEIPKLCLYAINCVDRGTYGFTFYDSYNYGLNSIINLNDPNKIKVNVKKISSFPTSVGGEGN